MLWRTFKLILPAWVPSWRFFDEIAPSPRIEYALLENKDMTATTWHKLRPHCEHVSPIEMFRRLFWNPDFNDRLFATSCAERLMAGSETCDHSHQEIMKRIRHDLKETGHNSITHPYCQFRLVFIYRAGEEINKVIAHQSEIEEVCNEP